MTQNTHKTQHPFRETWKDYFSFSTRVSRGLLVLSGLIFIEVIILIYLNFIPANTEVVDTQRFKKEIDAFYSAVDSVSSPEEVKYNFDYDSVRPSFTTGRDEPAKPELFSFNPNQLPDSGWKRLGFSAKQIRSIKNYEAKGGRFRSKEDVKKMYAIRENEFSRIEPYIVIPGQQPEAVRPRGNSKPKFHAVDIGTADTSDLEKLPLIGTYLAQKIFNYREWLGGFYSVSQVKEVRGLSDSAFQVIFPLLTLKDSTNVKKMDLNRAGFEELNRHPYIDKALAGIIIAYRRQHGAFSDPADLRKIALVDEELYRKIAPYLKAE